MAMLSLNVMDLKFGVPSLNVPENVGYMLILLSAMTELTEDPIVLLGYFVHTHFSPSHFRINIIFITQPETCTRCEVYYC